MHLVTNMRRRRTVLSVTGAILDGYRDTAELLDHEILDPQVVNLKTTRAIKVTKIAAQSPTAAQQECARACLAKNKSRQTVKDRAARRARGEYVPPMTQD